MQRRKFLQHTGILAGGLLLQNEWVGASAAGMPVRVGVMGCGDRGKGIMEIIGQLPEELMVTAVCDVLDFRLDETKKKFPAAGWKVYREHSS